MSINGIIFDFFFSWYGTASTKDSAESQYLFRNIAFFSWIQAIKVCLHQATLTSETI